MRPLFLPFLFAAYVASLAVTPAKNTGSAASPSPPTASAVACSESVSYPPPICTYTYPASATEFGSGVPPPPITTEVRPALENSELQSVPLNDDTRLFSAVPDTEGTVVQPRTMPIAQPIIGSIVGAFALFVAVNVVFIWVGCRCCCPQRQAGDELGSPSSRGQTTRTRAQATVAARIPLRSRPPNSHASANTAADLNRMSHSGGADRGERANYASAMSEGRGRGQDVEMLPLPMTPPAAPSPAPHSGLGPAQVCYSRAIA